MEAFHRCQPIEKMALFNIAQTFWLRPLVPSAVPHALLNKLQDLRHSSCSQRDRVELNKAGEAIATTSDGTGDLPWRHVHMQSSTSLFLKS